MLRIYKDDYGFHFISKLFNTNINTTIYKTYPTAWTLGIRNLVPSGKRIIFCDYDMHLLEHITPEIQHIQKKYHLSNFYILKSSQKPNGWHAICLDELTLKEMMRILQEMSCDEYFRLMPVKHDQHSWVLRSIGKAGSKAPKLVKIIKSPHQERKKSLAHYLYLKYHFGLKTPKPKNCDNNKKVFFIEYGTMNYIDIDKTKNLSHNQKI